MQARMQQSIVQKAARLSVRGRSEEDLMDSIRRFLLFAAIVICIF